MTVTIPTNTLKRYDFQVWFRNLDIGGNRIDRLTTAVTLGACKDKPMLGTALFATLDDDEDDEEEEEAREEHSEEGIFQ